MAKRAVALMIAVWVALCVALLFRRDCYVSQPTAVDASAPEASTEASTHASLREIGIPDDCIPIIPNRSTTTSRHTVIWEDGTEHPLPPVCPFLREHRVVRRSVGSTTQGVWGWEFQAIEPYDAKYNAYDAFSSIVTTGQYAWFTQVVASWTVLPLPTATGVTWNSFIGLQTNNNANGLGHGLSVLQPQVIQFSNTAWQIQLVFCCDEFTAGINLGFPDAGDTITVGIKVDNRFPPQFADPSLGRNWVMSANDTGPGGAADANFGSTYVSVFVPELEGPIEDVSWAAETLTGAATVAGYAGGAGTTTTATIHSLYQYNPKDGGNIPIVPNFNPCRTFSLGNSGISRDCFGTDGASGSSSQFVWITGGQTPIGSPQIVIGSNPSQTQATSGLWASLVNCTGGTTGVNCDGGMTSFNATDGVKAQWWLNW